MSSKLTIEWLENDETGPEDKIPLNSRLSAEDRLYPFAFVKMEEYFLEREETPLGREESQ